jgi:hypothetical protein
VLRRLKRRQQWAKDWERFANVGRVNRVEAAREIAILIAEIENLKIPLWRMAAADQSNSRRSGR